MTETCIISLVSLRVQPLVALAGATQVAVLGLLTAAWWMTGSSHLSWKGVSFILPVDLAWYVLGVRAFAYSEVLHEGNSPNLSGQSRNAGILALVATSIVLLSLEAFPNRLQRVRVGTLVEPVQQRELIRYDHLVPHKGGFIRL